ncbi:iron uptake porin [Scytonema sp. NUACC26]|uniref:iron uptake porin n=1 Tax=Scytonema sp. NUACC26 TaxID=3140176 RepID=UPI0034DBAE16
MKKTLWHILLTLPKILVLLLVVANTKAFGGEPISESHPDLRVAELLEPVETKNQELKPEQSDRSISQNSPQITPIEPRKPSSEPPVTSVSQLSDVQPTDWAFQALQSLVERYSCIVGYPDGQYRGDRALTRYEFAAGLNACLDQVNQLIASSTANLVTQEDLTTLQRLSEEFRPELAELAGRIDNLEARTAQVEANRFSTTTKLVGNVIFLAADVFGDRVNNTPADDTDDDANAFFAYRAQLSFQTSFSGEDQLNAILRADSIPNLGASTGTNMTRFAIDRSGLFPENDLYLENLYYRFPIGSKVNVWVGTRTINFPVFVPTFNQLNGNPSQGGFSRFGQFNPTVYRPGFDGAGAAVAYRFNNQLQLHLGWIADGLVANQPNNGIFNNSSQAAIAQLSITPSKQLDLGLTYTRKYYPTNSGNNLTGGTGSAFARNPFGQNATISDNFGLEFSWKVNPRFTFGGWFGYTQAHQVDRGDNDATIINGALTFAFPDLFSKGNLGGITIGIPPKVTSNDFISAGQQREDPDTSLHLETFYTFRINNNVRVTPIVYLITKPEHNDNNDPILVGVLRTSFAF